MKAVLFLVAVLVATVAYGQKPKPMRPLKNLDDAATKTEPEIEFRVLLIIKRLSDTYSPLFLPIRARMTNDEVSSAQRCFEVETPSMVDEITGGKVRFVPTVKISDTPLRIFSADRRDSAEYSEAELLNELATFATPGQFDSVGYLFLHYDTASGYSIPRAGYGVGGFNGKYGLGMFAINCVPQMNPRDEIFLHEWMHGLDGFYGGKAGVKLPKGLLHGTVDHGYRDKPFRPQDTFRGWMEWYRDYLNCNVMEDGISTGLGSVAWSHGPMRSIAGEVNYEVPLPEIRPYPKWVYELMKGKFTNAVLGPSLLEKKIEPKMLANETWKLEMWAQAAGTSCDFLPAQGGVLAVSNPNPNDAGLARTVSLEPFRNYLFSADVRTEGVVITQEGGKYGATLSAGSSITGKAIVGTTKWTPVSIPFTTGAKAEAVRLKMSLGGHASVAGGRAFFRNVQLRQIDYPTGVVAEKPKK